jgi:hypothetical protein
MNNAKAIVIEPELDFWIWGSDNALSEILEWPGTHSSRQWLRGRGYLFDRSGKPVRPKEALDELTKRLEQPRSSVLYEKITARISLAQCVDPAFRRLRSAPQAWFPP